METINLNKMIDVYSNYPTDGGVFSPMSNAPWADTMSGTNLDILYLDGHSGERYCSNFINHRLNDSDVLSSDNRTLIANILWAMFGIQWTRLWATMKPLDYDPLTNYKMQETAEGEESSTRTPDLTKGDTGTVQTTGQDKRTPNLTKGDTGTVQTTGQDKRTPDITKGDTGTVQTTGQDTRTPNLTRNGTGTVNDEGSGTNKNQNGIWGFNSSESVPSDMSDGRVTNNNTTTRNLTDTETGTETTDRTNTDTYNRSYTETGTDTTERTNTDIYNRSYTETGTDTTERTNTDTYNRSYTETGTDTTDRTNTDTYNRSYTETGTDTTSGTSSRKLTRTGNIGTNTFQNLLQQERNIWMYDFFEQVFKDVDSVLTIPIY